MIHNAIYRSQIIDFTKEKIRQHPCPRVAEFFLTKLGEKIFSLHCKINRMIHVIGKAPKRIFWCVNFGNPRGRVS